MTVLDVAAENRNYKGKLAAQTFASFRASATRPELYVAETYFSRGDRGERTDVLTIYDKTTLLPLAEIILPGNKRGMVVTEKSTLALIGNERFALVYNFTPAASVTIVDLDARAVVNEIPIPGCALVVPTGKRGFSSFCADGTLGTYRLDETGQLIDETFTEPFIDIDNDPMYTRHVRLGDIGYFPTFGGMMQPIDFSGDQPELLENWSLMADAEFGILERLYFWWNDLEAKWGPSGWQMITARNNELYVLMNPLATEGEQDTGGIEVWVFDIEKKRKVREIALEKGVLSIEITGKDGSHLVAMNEDQNLDVYDALTGKHLRTISGGLGAPVVLHGLGQ